MSTLKSSHHKPKKFLKGRKDAYAALMATALGRAKQLETTRFERQNGVWKKNRLEEKLRSEGCNGLENGGRKTKSYVN